MSRKKKSCAGANDASCRRVSRELLIFYLSVGFLAFYWFDWRIAVLVVSALVAFRIVRRRARAARQRDLQDAVEFYAQTRPSVMRATRDVNQSNRQTL